MIGDGFSVAAVIAQVPSLLPLMEVQETRAHPRADFCRPPLPRRRDERCGEILPAKVTVLLIGERPGLATAESLSAYMAYRANAGTRMRSGTWCSRHSCARNIDSVGGSAELSIADAMMVQRISGIRLVEKPSMRQQYLESAEPPTLSMFLAHECCDTRLARPVRVPRGRTKYQNAERLSAVRQIPGRSPIGRTSHFRRQYLAHIVHHADAAMPDDKSLSDASPSFLCTTDDQRQQRRNLLSPEQEIANHDLQVRLQGTATLPRRLWYNFWKHLIGTQRILRLRGVFG